MATGGNGDAPEKTAVRRAALEGTIAALESRLKTAAPEERGTIAAELASARRELESLRSDAGREAETDGDGGADRRA
jgi:hypothetical protein